MNYVPVEVSDLDVSFGGRAMKILPPMGKIPAKFKNFNNVWCRWVENWFYSGLKELPKAKEGVDLNLALLNIKACLGDFEPSQEHKIYGAGYLASLWFELPQ